MRQSRHELEIATSGQGLYEVTAEARRFVEGAGIALGLLTTYVHHTSASLVIQENADAAVQHDLLAFFKRLVEEDPALYRHGSEGPDDMPAHIRSALTATSLTIPVTDGRLDLGRWQGIYLFEHRRRGRRRRITLHLIGS